MFLELNTTQSQDPVYLNIKEIVSFNKLDDVTQVNTHFCTYFVYETIDQIRAMLTESYFMIKPSSFVKT